MRDTNMLSSDIGDGSDEFVDSDVLGAPDVGGPGQVRWVRR